MTEREPLTVAAAVARIRELNPELCALVDERRLEYGLVRDQELASSQEPPAELHRVPFTLKDVWDVEGCPTRGGSTQTPAGNVARSGLVHRTFEKAGAVCLGKTNLSDRELTPESQSYVGGVTSNPHDQGRTAGGSSGGAAAAVASRMATFDWGTDFGGSIRLPAAFCGIVGLRLSRSSWPVPDDSLKRSTIVWRLNGMGPLTRDLTDCARVLRAAQPLRRSAPAQPAFAGLRIFGPDRKTEGEWPHFEQEAAQLCERSDLGHGPANLPSMAQVERVFNALLASHVHELRSSPPAISRPSILRALARAGDRRIHPQSARVLAELEILRRLRPRSSARAEMEATQLRSRTERLFDQGFVLLSPTTTYSAPRHGRALSLPGLATFAKLANLCDATALSVPFGHFSDGLPRGLQLMGPAGSEDRLLELARALMEDHAFVD